MSSAEIISKLQSEISQIEASGETTVPISMVKEMMASLRDIFSMDDGAHNTTAELYSEVGQVAIFLNGAKKELAKIGGGDDAGQRVTEASDHLAETMEMTEQATNTIMASSEKIQELAAGLPIEDEVNDLVTQVFEACNFQDVTGQRIQKVVEILQRVEQMVLRMVLVFGLSAKGDQLDDATREELSSEAELLSGPALKGQGLEQDQIDDMLDALLGESS